MFFFRIGRDLEGTDIKDFLLGRILDTLIDQSQDSQNDENNTQKLHGIMPTGTIHLSASAR